MSKNCPQTLPWHQELTSHHNLRESGTSSPPEGIGEALYLREFNFPLTFPPSCLIKK